MSTFEKDQESRFLQDYREVLVRGWERRVTERGRIVFDSSIYSSAPPEEGLCPIQVVCLNKLGYRHYPEDGCYGEAGRRLGLSSWTMARIVAAADDRRTSAAWSEKLRNHLLA